MDISEGDDDLRSISEIAQSSFCGLCRHRSQKAEGII